MAAQGIEKIPIRIPEKWDPVWYSRHIREVLALADTRNAFEGPGISITGTSDVPATISASADILNLLQQAYVLAAPSSFLPNERTLQPQIGVTTITDNGPNTTIVVGVAANGIGNAQIRQSQALSVVGRIFNSVGDVADITAYADGDVLRVLPNSSAELILGFGDIVLRPSNFANPTAVVSAAAVNGTAITAMRSDAAPALDPAYVALLAGSAITKTDDTNVTLTLGGSATTALLRAASLTLGWTGQLAVSRGGTGNSSLGALTKTDDTNVTLTLGGSPTTALVNAASLTLGWTGTLAPARGGTGIASYTAGDLLYATGATTLAKLAAGSNTNVLTMVAGAPAWAAASGGASGANPTASVGLTAVNGVATTYLRSDGAPALDQGIAPTWSGIHTFQTNLIASLAYGAAGQEAIRMDSSQPVMSWIANTQATDAKKWFAFVTGTTWRLQATNDAETVSRAALSIVRGAGNLASMTYGNNTDLPLHTFQGAIAAVDAAWTGQQTFTGNAYAVAASGSVLVGQLAASPGNFALIQMRGGGPADQAYWLLSARSNGDFGIDALNDSLTVVRSALYFNRLGVAISNIAYGNTTDNPTHTFAGSIIGNVQHNAAAATGAASSGTYTPTGTGVANVASITPEACQWMRVGNVVTVSGICSVTATLAATTTRFGLTLPIASALTNRRQCIGAASDADSLVAVNGSAYGDATNDRVEIQYTAPNTGANGIAFTFTYLIL